MEITRIGLDLAKDVFQVFGVNRQGRQVVCKQFKRNKLLAFFAQQPPCLVGMEACGGAHYWARELLKQGHDVRLMAPKFVTPYRKNEKNDVNDAQAICEAVGRPTMRFVPIKSLEQQAILTVHRARTLRVGDRTALVNQIRGLLAEFGLVMPAGILQVRKRLPDILENAENDLPDVARDIFGELYTRLRALDEEILFYDQQVQAIARSSDPAKRLMQLEGVGPITATAFVASIGDGRCFKNGRQLAAWLGLTPRQHSSGGKSRLGRMSKRGDVYLRTLLIHGTRSVLRLTGKRTDAKSRWVEGVKARSGNNVAAVALAAKQARVIWALLAREEVYRPAV